MDTHLQKFPDDDDHSDPHVKHWDVQMNRVIVPDDSDTTYYCKIVKSPHVYDVKHQIIGVSQRKHEIPTFHALLTVVTQFITHP